MRDDLCHCLGSSLTSSHSVLNTAAGKTSRSLRRRAAYCASGFRRDVFDAAVRDVGPKGFHPHELRHTAASLAIASGADVKIVQQMLGHRTATMTLDLYGHLFPDRLNDVADRMDLAARAPNVPTLDHGCTFDATTGYTENRTLPRFRW
jgi:hypothetical protein